jgi:hypothetical protein
MNALRGEPRHAVSVDVTEEMPREAEMRGLLQIDYLALLIVKGRQALNDAPALSNALERIRALRGKDAKGDRTRVGVAPRQFQMGCKGGDYRSCARVDAPVCALLD